MGDLFFLKIYPVGRRQTIVSLTSKLHLTALAMHVPTSILEVSLNARCHARLWREPVNKANLVPVLKNFVAKWEVQITPNGLNHAVTEEKDKVLGKRYLTWTW